MDMPPQKIKKHINDLLKSSDTKRKQTKSKFKQQPVITC